MDEAILSVILCILLALLGAKDALLVSALVFIGLTLQGILDVLRSKK